MKAGKHSFVSRGVTFNSKWALGPFEAHEMPHIRVTGDRDGFWKAYLDSTVQGIQSRFEKSPQAALLDLETRLYELKSEIRRAIKVLDR